MGTIHQDVAEERARELLRTPQGASALAEADDWRRKNTGTPVADAFGQPYRGWTMGQLAALAMLIYLFDLGYIRATHIDVGAAPSSDKAREANQAKLANLPLGITAEVYDGLSHDGDGHVVLPEDLIIAGDNDGEIEPEVTGPIPLEIGYTYPSRTIFHLGQSKAVARWPYGHERIFVLAITELGTKEWWNNIGSLRRAAQLVSRVGRQDGSRGGTDGA